MADQETCTDIRLLKRTTISVFVDEALPDILVVTYEYGVKIFKGVLLDSTKRNLPCGIETLNPALKPKTDKNPGEDTLYAVNQRFAYTNPETAKKRNVSISSNKYKNNKMTVRLRPRQVLCSKCKGICTENSENVGKKRKISDIAATPPKRGANAPVTRSTLSDTSSRKKAAPQDGALTRNVNKLNIYNNAKKPLLTVSNLNTTLNIGSRSLKRIEETEEQSDCTSDTGEIASPKLHKTRITPSKIHKKVLRKKGSIDCMEEAWDESGVEENTKNSLTINNNTNCESSSSCSSTRTIKISYGPQGEGTVLKIPAQIESLPISEDSEENANAENAKLKSKVVGNKAARKALKKAKKEARRKVLLGHSPSYVGNISPRYALSASSPRYALEGVSPRHGLGNNSPRYVSAAAYELSVPRRRKHKMKHKKKHREDRKHKDGDSNISQDEAVKEQCITQKLSINLKRLNNTYTSFQAADKTEESSSDEHSEQVPDFPPPNPPLMLRINAKTVSSALGADGGRLLVGDVVWGKIHGFPWWPGKVLTITNSDNQSPQAHVAWYGSSTSSLMLCDQLCPYLENFKTRFNKKKRGPYKEAIRQAMLEAKENAENRLQESVVASPLHSLITVVPPALASPREIDVVS